MKPNWNWNTCTSKKHYRPRSRKAILHIWCLWSTVWTWRNTDKIVILSLFHLLPVLLFSLFSWGMWRGKKDTTTQQPVQQSLAYVALLVPINRTGISAEVCLLGFLSGWHNSLLLFSNVCCIPHLFFYFLYSYIFFAMNRNFEAINLHRWKIIIYFWLQFYEQFLVNQEVYFFSLSLLIFWPTQCSSVVPSLFSQGNLNY